MVAGIESRLREVLGSSYEHFSSNFEEAGNPYSLKDGGVFVGGWRAGKPGANAATLVYYADGSVFAAYFDQETGRVSYFGGKPGDPHLALQIWALRFSADEPGASLPAFGAEEVEEFAILADPNPEVQAAMPAVASAIWSPEISQYWNMNSDVGDVLGLATKDILDCSKAFSLVPRPVGWVPGWSYVAKTAGQIVAYVSGVSDNKTYYVCVVTTASKRRDDVELASIGI